MDTTAVLDIGLQALWLTAKLCAPILITALAVGFAISLAIDHTSSRSDLVLCTQGVGCGHCDLHFWALDDRGNRRLYQRNVQPDTDSAGRLI